MIMMMMIMIIKSSKWYEHKPPGVLENGSNKILWGFNVHCDHLIERRRPDIAVINKNKREFLIIDIAVPGNGRVKAKEQEKVKKYQDLNTEIANVWSVEKGHCYSCGCWCTRSGLYGFREMD